MGTNLLLIERWKFPSDVCKLECTFQHLNIPSDVIKTVYKKSTVFLNDLGY